VITPITSSESRKCWKKIAILQLSVRRSGECVLQCHTDRYVAAAWLHLAEVFVHVVL